MLVSTRGTFIATIKAERKRSNSDFKTALHTVAERERAIEKNMETWKVKHKGLGLHPTLYVFKYAYRLDENDNIGLYVYSANNKKGYLGRWRRMTILDALYIKN